MDPMPTRAERPSGRVLYISGSIGLGHAARDLAIAAALRREVPNLQIDWLAGDPARRLIAGAGETVLEESSGFDETPIAEASAEAFSLNLADYVRRARGAWSSAIRAFAHVVTANRYDVVIGDEAYEIAGHLGPDPDRRCHTAPPADAGDHSSLPSAAAGTGSGPADHGSRVYGPGRRRPCPATARLLLFDGGVWWAAPGGSPEPAERRASASRATASSTARADRSPTIAENAQTPTQITSSTAAAMVHASLPHPRASSATSTMMETAIPVHMAVVAAGTHRSQVRTTRARLGDWASMPG